jgi:beta-xylosidase
MVVRDGSTYYAYSSPTGGRYLPVLTSTDLKTWIIHPNWSPVPAEIQASSQSDGDKRNLNDGLVRPASWGQPNGSTGPWINRDLWAPGVIKMGSTWFAYHAVRVSNAGDDPNNFGRFCLTVATASSPLGPFRDTSGGAPIQCQSAGTDPSGSIDPSPYYDEVAGKYFLLWKAAGMIGVRESRLMSVEISSVDGKPVPGATPTEMLQTERGDPWEGGTIENPSMVKYNGWTYLFYSANSSLAGPNNLSTYATGYAICYFGPSYPCTRVQHVPVHPFLGEAQGPGVPPGS